MRTLNLGILAHVDAGKTTLTERLLFAAGAIDKIGSVDDGTTQTDYMALERERGITIRSAVASFVIDDLSVNLIDTPGHPDFIAEVERVLSVLDAAILLVSAVEGIQPQTPLLMRALQRQGVPTLLFINKIDRAGADTVRVIGDLKRRLALNPVPLGRVIDEGTRSARYENKETDEARADLLTALAENDEQLLENLVADGPLPSWALLGERLAQQVANLKVQPVVLGSALMGVGVDAVFEAVATLLPAAQADSNAPLSARVFKVERTREGAKSALARIYAGRIVVRDHLSYGNGHGARVTQLSVYAPGGSSPAQAADAGQIAALSGLTQIRVGDFIGEQPPALISERQFAPPTLESVVVALSAADRGRMRAALLELADQDPLINVRQSDDQEISVSLYGDVQREVIEATLERDYGVKASFRATTVLHVERPAGSASEEQLIKAATHTNISGRSSPDSDNPYRATLGLRIEPTAPGTGVQVALDVDVRLVPMYIFNTVGAFETALNEYAREALREGPHGWEVTDCRLTVWDSGYSRTGSTARDFRLLATEVVRTVLNRAGTVVCEPMTRLRLEIPPSSAPVVMKLLGQLGVRVQGQFSTAELATISGVLPASQIEEVKHRLPGATSGEGVLETEFAGYEPVSGPPPERRRRRVD